MTVIAMTREIGSHGTDVAAGLADELGLKIINSEIVAGNVAGSLGVEESTVQHYLEGSASMFERWQIDKRKLSRYTFEEILSLAQQGNVLIRGWGAAALFRDIPQVISVRVCAPMALRERVMMERLGVNEAGAIRQEIERFDAANASTMRASFNINHDDALLYHIVLNTSQVSIDACVKTVCQLAKAPRFQDDAATKSALADKLLEIKVSAALTEHFGIGAGSVTVSAANGRIILDGVTSTGSLRAEKLARGIEGVNEIDNRIKSVPRYGRELSYPTRPVRVIGGFAAGGAFDITARLIGQSLSEGLGQPFVIENRSEAGGKFPAEAVARASADGHTLVLIGAPDAINATLYDKLNFSLVHDIAPVAGIIRLPSVMVVPSSFPAKTVPEFIAYARANPAALKMASAGNGSTSHALGELFQMMAGITITHAPYRGGAPAVADLLGGHAQVMFVVLPASIEHIKTGNLHPLAVTAATRLEALPDIPTLGEFLPGYEASGWQGIGAPKETPAHILSKLNKEINAGLTAPKMKARLANLGGALLAGSPADFGELIAAETEKWARVIKLASINVE